MCLSSILQHLRKKVCQMCRTEHYRDQGTVGDSEHRRVGILPLEAFLGPRHCALIVRKARDECKFLSRCQNLQPRIAILWQAIHDYSPFASVM